MATAAGGPPPPPPSRHPLPAFHHPSYTLVDNDQLVRTTKAADHHHHQTTTSSSSSTPPRDHDELQSVLESLSTYLKAYLKARFDMVEAWIPSDDADYKCDVLLSARWDSCDKLLVVLQNHVGSVLGLWSRSTCLVKGLRQGSMIPFLEKAQEGGYGVIICNPNMNSVMVYDDKKAGSSSSSSSRKVAIPESSFPEEHAMFVYENYVSHCKARQVYLVGYGNGAILCKEMVQRQLARCQHVEEDNNRITAIATIEASVVITEDDSADVKAFMGKVAVNWDSHLDRPFGATIPKAKAKLGVSQVISVGSSSSSSNGSSTNNGPESGGEEEDFPSTVASIARAMDSVFRYFSLAQTLGSEANKGYRFACEEAVRFQLPVPLSNDPSSDGGSKGEEGLEEGAPSTEGFFGRLIRSLTGDNNNNNNNNNNNSPRKNKPVDAASVLKLEDQFGCKRVSLNEKIAIDDFDLHKVVGKGAFGKVMLVKKKKGLGAGSVYAMKVLKKSVIVEKGQIEHTLSERAILLQIHHPFIVRLRFAFQNEHNLYLVTDYYSGGTLFAHLRRAGCFEEKRAKFYAAEILLALDHLHQQHIIYRDLKCENVLVGTDGHIALTDFGLSKQGVSSQFGANTFCGTAEYIAPELLKGNRYGVAVDWWSFGILLYEMLNSTTPFYNRNRKYMFHCIINVRPTFPATFSLAACSIIYRLLDTDPLKRLGSGPTGAKEIKDHEFFRLVDWDLLYRKEVEPPFKPKLKHEMDTKFVSKNCNNLVAKDTICETKHGDNEKVVEFKEFTFVDNYLSQQDGET